MRILFITQWFQPEPFLNGIAFAKELVKLGHSVQVLTGYPNYPGGKLYDGYKIKFLQRENRDGVSIIRVPLYPNHDNSGVHRFFNYISYALAASIIGPWVVDQADVAYVYHPPATACLPACVIRLLRHIPFVYNIQDIWPDALASSGMFKNKFGLWLVDQFCHLFYRMASKIVAQSPGFKLELSNNRGVPADKIEVIYNWCDHIEVKSTEKNMHMSQELGFANRFNILFAGGMGKGQALGAVLDAAKILQTKCPSVRFVFIGDGVEMNFLKQKKNALALENVIFLPRRPTSEIGAIMNLSDVLLVHLKDNFLHEITIPSKVQAYLAVGKPVLIAIRGDAADLVEKAQAGIKCQPENPQDIADTVFKFQSMSHEQLEQMGQNGKKFYEQHLSLSTGTRRYEQIFQSVVSKNSKTNQ